MFIKVTFFLLSTNLLHCFKHFEIFTLKHLQMEALTQLNLLQYFKSCMHEFLKNQLSSKYDSLSKTNTVFIKSFENFLKILIQNLFPSFLKIYSKVWIKLIVFK